MRLSKRSFFLFRRQSSADEKEKEKGEGGKREERGKCPHFRNSTTYRSSWYYQDRESSRGEGDKKKLFCFPSRSVLELRMGNKRKKKKGKKGRRKRVVAPGSSIWEKKEGEQTAYACISLGSKKEQEENLLRSGRIHFGRPAY